MPFNVLNRQLRTAVSTGGTIRVPKAKPSDLDTSEFSFNKFAATYFHSTNTGQYSRRPLKKSLLDHDFPIDEVAAQAIWIMILRFMGDMAEAKFEEEINAGPYDKRSSVMQRLTVNLSKSAVQQQEFTDTLMSLEVLDYHRFIRKTLKRKTKLPDMLRKVLDNADEINYYQQTLDTRSSNLDKLHFIIGHGILRPKLRDEILSQICKQLTNNPNRTSYAKGWILLSLCIGCFPPSKRFENFLRCFIRNGPQLYSAYCENRLDRTLKNGSRSQPPSWLELQATRSKTPITLQVHVMDGNIHKLQVDSASTASEAVLQLCDKIGITDNFGFSMVVTLYDKVMSLGSGHEYILDAVSQCEQYAKEQGQNERKAPWKLHMRKEIFAPWYDPTHDVIATNIIYKQIMRGLNHGEYRCRMEKDIAMICALAFYAEVGPNMNQLGLRKLIPDFVPTDLIAMGEKSLFTWEVLIKDAFQRNDYVRRRAPRQHAKEDICLFAHISWPMLFSRFFEAVRTAGPTLLSDNLVIAVNSNGVYFVDETEQILAELTYAEVLKVYFIKVEGLNVNELHIDTVQKENFTFKCYESQDVVDLINYMVENLKLRSKYGIAMHDERILESEGNEQLRRLCMSKGDLVQFETNGAAVLDENNRWALGICNGAKGEFPTDAVQVLATLTKPTEKIIQIYKESADNSQNQRQTYVKYNTRQRQRMHTLKKFAESHFRANPNFDGNNTPSIHTMDSKNAELWRHSRDLLKAPLLQQLQQQSDCFQLAVGMFNNILKYMGDIPRGKASPITDLIFTPPLQNPPLRDELYCQLMKQLTENRVQYSEERGWELMYLATGVVHPSPLVMKELTEFLRSRSHALASISLKRVKRTLMNGQRKYPPHTIEVEGIQQRCMHIYHKIYFPDNTVEAFEIESFTRCSDLLHEIMERFQLKIHDGYSLFVHIEDKTFSVPEDEFIFDYVNELMQWIQQSMPMRATEVQIDCSYQLHCMKKLWLSPVIPGKDINADVIFHYPQEVSKYLSGFYKVNKDLAIRMAAPIYLAEYGHNWMHMQTMHETLSQLVPEDLASLLKLHEWKSQISSALKKLLNADINEVQAKQLVLASLAEQNMYGSTFFLVRQTNDQSLPEAILIAINRRGFHIIDAHSKDVLQAYDYTELSFWSSGSTYFHIRFGNMIGASKLFCNTTQGYKIDDLLSSYINYFNKSNKSYKTEKF